MDLKSRFFDAARRGDATAIADLIRRDPDLVRAADDHGKTGLHWAAEHDWPEAARALIDAGADLESTTTWGATPLAWAATMGGGRVAEVLLSRGAGGLTLIVAAGLGLLEPVRSAVESGADLRAHRRKDAPAVPDDHWPGDSAHILGDVISDALYAAARNGHTEVVKYLIDRGAAIDAKGVFGGTALHWAAFNGHRETVEFLLSRGARRDLRDKRFDATPAAWAREGGYRGIAEDLDPDPAA